MSRTFAFAVPGDLATPTGGYAYDRRMIAELARVGWKAEIVDLGGEFPTPSAACRAAAEGKLAAVPQRRPVVVDGLALGVMPEAAATVAASHSLIALVHHPLALETGLSRAQADALRASERAALAAAHHVIVTGKATARLLAADYAVPTERITVAVPGIDAVSAPPRAEDGSISLLSVGALVPRKGYDILLEALATLPGAPWRLTIVGARDRDPATTAKIEAMIAARGFGQRVTLAGVVTAERLAELYAGADLFVLPSRFEGYGMAFADALAHGVPVIGSTAGAVPETVPAGAGVLVAPDDAAALAQALHRLMDNKEERRSLAEGARRASALLPSWAQSAQIFARVLERAA